MSRAKRRDTVPELALRRELHRRGLRYRVDHPLPGLRRRRADVLFGRAKVAVFVDGCPVHSTTPKANRRWWIDKIAANKARDRDTDDHLEQLGWLVLRFWEHENPIASADEVAIAVAVRRPA